MTRQLQRTVLEVHGDVHRRRAEFSQELMERLIGDAPAVKDVAAALRGRRRWPVPAVFRRPDRTADPILQAARLVAEGAPIIRATVSYGEPILADLAAIGDAGVPVLYDDIIVSDYQVWEARAYGADGVVLIAGVLDRAHLARLSTVVSALGMTPVVEVHDEADIDALTDLAAPLIAVRGDRSEGAATHRGALDGVAALLLGDDLDPSGLAADTERLGVDVDLILADHTDHERSPVITEQPSCRGEPTAQLRSAAPRRSPTCVRSHTPHHRGAT